MRKSFLVLMVVLSLLLCIYSVSFAQTYVAQTNMPLATGITVTASRIDSKGTETPADDTWAANPGLTLDMGALIKKEGTANVIGPDLVTRNLTWIVFLPQFYFALDVGFNGGIDTTKSVSVAMTGETFPAGAVDKLGNPSGLGTRGNIFYSKTVLSSWILNQTVDNAILPFAGDAPQSRKRYFKTPVSISLLNVTGGWLRLYLGTANGNPTPLFGVDPDYKDATYSLFTPSDPTGTYTATLTLTYG